MIINKLGFILKERDMSKAAFASLLGRTPAWIYWLSKSTTVINTRTLDMLCAALHVQPGELLEYVPSILTSRQERKEGVSHESHHLSHRP